MKTYSVTKIALLFGAGLLLFAPSQVQAAEDTRSGTESILLSPTSKRYEINAGGTETDTFKVVNDGQTDYTFVVYARPYSVNSEDYTPDFASEAQNADAYKWVQFEKTSYEIKAGQSIEVGYTIRVPKGATPGGHYGVLFAETQQNAGETSGTTILRKKRVGAILYTTVKGDVRTSGSFVSADVPFFQFKAPLKARQRVANKGNTDFPVVSKVLVTDVFGGIKFKTEKETFVLPSSTRAINNDWLSPSWIGVYKVEQSAKFLDTDKTSSSYVLLIPIWVYVTLGALITGRMLYAIVRRRARKNTK